MTNEEQLYLALGYCTLMVFLAIIFKSFPPTKINSLYGYRTRRSMTNDTIWKAANTFWPNLFLKLNIACFILPGILYFTFPQQNLLTTVIINTVLVIAIIFITERHLNQSFDKDGNPKNI